MNARPIAGRPKALTLPPLTAAELMTANPLSVRAGASAAEAAAFLVERRISAAPVIDEAGRPVGVVSQSDLMIHRAAGPSESRVADLMTPAVFSVPPEAPAARVVKELLRLGVHRLYVVDGLGVLVGVVTALDVLRRLDAGL